MSVDSTT